MRELLAAKEAGFEIYVLSGLIEFKGEALTIKDYIDDNNFKISYLTLPKWKRIFLFSMLRQYFTIAKVIKSYYVDVISGHDIYALTMAYLSTIFMKKSKNPILVYDSHEFEIVINDKRSKLEHFIILHLERFLARRCKINIMVNNSIANEVQKIHKLKEKPLVVRSIPNYWEIDKDVIKARREEILNKLNADKNSFVAIYHGMIMPHRGIEQAIEAISKSKDIFFVVMGKALNENYLQKVLNQVKENNFEDRFLLLPPMPADRIWEYTGACDIGIMLIQCTVKSYELCLPNKFFETLQSETPILASNFIEMRNLIREYNIGEVCNPRDLNDICDKLIQMKTNKEKYKAYKANIKIAKIELCWENEKHVFLNAFKGLYSEMN